MRYVIILGFVIVCLGLPTIHLQHHLNLPKLETTRIEVSYKFASNAPWFLGKVYDIRMNNEIKKSDLYKDVFTVLETATKNDLIRFHLNGYGGDAQTMIVLINKVRETEATTIMYVEGDVYSAHAFLALSGNYIVMSMYSFMMFHTISIYGYDCSKVLGTDRTVSKALKCEQYLAVMVNQANQIIDSLKYLTEEEKNYIKAGGDVYLDSVEFYKRAEVVQ